jgi:eukaryotic-like serine/threonine-protein kinase
VRPDLIRQRVAGYHIERVLGRGGSGSVYLAHKDGRAVALKIMHEHDRGGVGRKRFEREAALVKKLRHPNVVELFDFGHTDDGLPFIVFELLEGESLKEALAAGGFSDHRAATIALSVLDALIAAHGMGIIHRDIKPGNIFLRSEPSREEVQVLDFGLAKALVGDRIETATLTRTGYRLGTPRYMSPEMARGLPVEEGSDLYSLGLVLAEMIAGRPVIEGDVHVTIMLQHASDDPLALPSEVTNGPLAEIVAQALDKRLERRFRSASAMREALSAVLGACERPQPPAAPPPPPRLPPSPPRPSEAPPRPSLQGDGPTLLLAAPSRREAAGGAPQSFVPTPAAKRAGAETLEDTTARASSAVDPSLDGSTQVWVNPDAPTQPLYRPPPPSSRPALPRVEPWQAAAVGMLLALTLFALGLALVR